jgi:hypothetical protein
MDDKLTDALIAEVVAEVRQDGYDTVVADDVIAVAKYGSVDEGNISEEYDERVSDRILEALDARGVAV